MSINPSTDERLLRVLTAAEEGRLLAEHAWADNNQDAWYSVPATYWVRLPGMDAVHDLTTTVKGNLAASWADGRAWLVTGNRVPGPHVGSAWTLQHLTAEGLAELTRLRAVRA